MHLYGVARDLVLSALLGLMGYDPVLVWLDPASLDQAWLTPGALFLVVAVCAVPTTVILHNVVSIKRNICLARRG